MASLHGQHAPAVDAAARAALAPHAAALADFVRLAKWEDRGYYANRAAAEKAARVLHRLKRRARAALAAPAAAVLAGAGRAMGLPDLAPTALAAADAEGFAKPPAADTVDEGAGEAAAGAWRELARAAAADAAAAAPPPAASRASSAPRYVSRIDALLAPSVASIAASPAGDAGAALDGLAASAAARAAALAADASPKARPRKKKALLDLFAALKEAGADDAATAVPRGDREPVAWFAAPPPEFGGLLARTPPSLAPRLPDWASAADAYYWRAVARLQRLWEAAKAPHADVSGGEARVAVRVCEHQLHLLRRGRAALAAAGDACARIDAAHKLAAGWAGPGGDGGGAAGAAALAAARAHAGPLAQRLADAGALVRAAAAAERCAPERGVLDGAAAWMERAAAGARAGAAALAAATAHVPPSALAPPDAASAARACLAGARELAAAGDAAAAAGGWAGRVPAWPAAAAALRAAAAAAGAADAGAAAPRPSTTPDAAAASARLPASADAAVGAILAWAQALARDAGAPPLLAALDAAEARLRPKAAAAVADALEKLVADAAAAADGGGGDQGEEPGWGFGRPRAGVMPKTLIYLSGGARPAARMRDSTKADPRRGAKSGREARGATADHSLPHLHPPPAAAARGALASVTSLLPPVRAAATAVALAASARARAAGKLAHVSASLLAALLEAGFCTTAGEEDREGEGDGGKGKGALDEGGVGLGAGSGARDISDQLDDEDQLLGARALDAPPEEQDDAPVNDKAKGVEMGDDFDAALHDVEPDAEGSDDGDDADADGDDDDGRLDQQMGDVGPDADDVDARLWDGDDEAEAGGEKPEEAADAPALPASDAGRREYGQGEDKPGDDGGKAAAPEAGGGAEPQDAANDEGGESGDDDGAPPGDDGPGAPAPGVDAPPEPLELPADMQLDGEGGGEGEGDEGDGGADADGADDQAAAAVAPDGGERKPTPDRPAAESDGDEGIEQAGGDGRDGDAAGSDDDGPAPPGAPDGPAPMLDDDLPADGESPTEPVSVPGDDEAPADAAAEAGPTGAAAAAADGGGIDGGGGDEAEDADMDAAADAGAGAADGGGGRGARAAGAADPAGAPRSARDGDAPPPPGGARHNTDAVNPHRSLAGALERWRAALASRDAPAEAGGAGGGGPGDDATPPEAEFVTGDDDGNEGNGVALGAATEEQAAAGVHGGDDDDDGAPAAPSDDEGMPDAPPLDDDGAAAAADAGGAGGSKRREQGDRERERERGASADGDRAGAPAAPHLDARPDGGPDAAHVGAMAHAPAALTLTGLDAEAERARLEADLASALAARAAPGGAPVAPPLWPTIAALTERTAADLAQALAAALEPTRASRLARGYKTGKRVDMRAVVAYVASGYRRDRIWMRRTRPDARAYRVALVVDDSRSVADAGVAPFAVEAVAATARALGRADLGDLAVLACGGGSGARLLHPFGAPLDDSAVAATVAGLSFAADATVGDTPAADALLAAGALLDADGGGGGGLGPLAQLVVVVGDGRFHEKAGLRAAAASLAARPGVLLVYVALDSASGGEGGPGASRAPTSLADLRTISFSPDGAPRATPYLDDFPFPHYVVLRRAAGLPAALGGVVRAWLEAARAAGGG